ncbi:MAG: iron-sulfur cluster assembly accessory protein [Acidobacteriota bacterium]|nr:iron-sulfur cluster assembly accessory protein [Acidobacteriota bacterium]
MTIVTLQTATATGAVASSPAPTEPTPGQAVLTADGEAAGAKGIQLTVRGLKRIRAAMAKEGITPDAGGLRVGITGGGCSGLSYNIRFDSQPRERDRVYAFAQRHLDPDATADAAPFRIFVDPKSFIYLHGMILDYEETLMRQGFNFINPNSTKSCGCGSSFSA